MIERNKKLIMKRFRNVALPEKDYNAISILLLYCKRTITRTIRNFPDVP